MISFNNKLIEKIFDKYVLITSRKEVSRDIFYSNKLKLTLMLGGNDVPVYKNGGLKRLGVIRFTNAYRKYTDEKKDKLLKLSLRRAESNYILNHCYVDKYPIIVCEQVVVGKTINREKAIPTKYEKMIDVKTKFVFYDNDDENHYPLYEIEGPTLEYKYLTDKKIIPNGAILSKFNLSPLDFQELYYRIEQCFASKYTDAMNVPHLCPDKSNIGDIIEYWKNIPVEDRKDWEPKEEYSMFGGQESRMLAYGDNIVTGSIDSSFDYDEREANEPEKIYKPRYVKADNTVKCTRNWIPSTNLKVGK